MVRESRRAAHPLQACLRLARPPLPAWVALAALAPPLLLLLLPVLAQLARAPALAQLAVTLFPQRVLLPAVLRLVVALVTPFLARVMLARARVLASQRPSTAAPDSAME